MKQNIYLSILLAALLALAGCGGGGGTSPLQPQIQLDQSELDGFATVLGTALKAGEAGTPTVEEIAAIEAAKRELDQAIADAVDGVNTETDQITMLLSNYENRLVAIRNTFPPQITLNKAVMELKDAVTAGDITPPTQALIDKIEMEIRELQAAIKSAASGVDTADATELITSSNADLIRIRGRFANPTPPTGTTNSTSTTTTTTTNKETELDKARILLAKKLQDWKDEESPPTATFITDIKVAHEAFDKLFMENSPGDRVAAETVQMDYSKYIERIERMELFRDTPQSTELATSIVSPTHPDRNWKISIQYRNFGAPIELNLGSQADFNRGSFWRSESDEVTNNDKTVKYQLEYYVHVPEATDENPDRMPVTDESVIFGAWVDESVLEGNNHGIQIYQKYPALSSSDFVSRQAAGTATYTGQVAGILELDDNKDGEYIASYAGQTGTVSLTATFDNSSANGADTLEGTLTGVGPSSTITLNQANISSNSVSGTIMGTNSGINEWKARFVHDGSWIVGSYDWEPNGNAGKTQAADTVGNDYERHKGAFGACTGASCATP